MVAYLTNYLFSRLQLADSWRWMLGVMVVPSVLFSILLFSIPESPRWLILKGDELAALPILQRLGESNTGAAINAIRESVKSHQESLFQRRYAKPILFAMLLAMFNQLSGINAILYYAPRIFELAGFSKESVLQPTPSLSGWPILFLRCWL